MTPSGIQAEKNSHPASEDSTRCQKRCCLVSLKSWSIGKELLTCNYPRAKVKHFEIFNTFLKDYFPNFQEGKM